LGEEGEGRGERREGRFGSDRVFSTLIGAVYSDKIVKI